MQRFQNTYTAGTASRPVPGGDWQDVEGAYGATYTLPVSEENVDNLWRVRLTLG